MHGGDFSVGSMDREMGERPPGPARRVLNTACTHISIRPGVRVRRAQDERDEFGRGQRTRGCFWVVSSEMNDPAISARDLHEYMHSISISQREYASWRSVASTIVAWTLELLWSE